MNTCELYASSLIYKGRRVTLCVEGTASADAVGHMLQHLVREFPGYCLHVVCPYPGREKGIGEKWMPRRPTYVVALERPMHDLDVRNLYRMGLHVLGGSTKPVDALKEFMRLHADDDYFNPNLKKDPRNETQDHPSA